MQMIIRGICLVAIVAATCFVQGQETQREHPLVPALKVVKESLEKLQSVKDYEANFTKKELIDGRLLEQKMYLRLREEPFSVYLKFIEPNAGREILYVTGQNNNQLRVHEGSGLTALIGTVSIPLDSATVKAENRHPVTEIGIRKMLELLIQQWELESKYGEIDVKFYPNAMMGNVACEVIESSHPQPRKQFNFHVTRLFLDKKTRLPIRIENYGFPEKPGARPAIVEEYTYTNLRTNIGLDTMAFSEKNRSYAFE